MEQLIPLPSKGVGTATSSRLSQSPDWTPIHSGSAPESLIAVFDCASRPAPATPPTAPRSPAVSGKRYDADGKRCELSDIPKNLSERIDDPFRSLVGELIRAGGCAKSGAPFFEFLWADFLRRRIKKAARREGFRHSFSKGLGPCEEHRCEEPAWLVGRRSDREVSRLPPSRLTPGFRPRPDYQRLLISRRIVHHCAPLQIPTHSAAIENAKARRAPANPVRDRRSVSPLLR